MLSFFLYITTMRKERLFSNPHCRSHRTAAHNTDPSSSGQKENQKVLLIVCRGNTKLGKRSAATLLRH